MGECEKNCIDIENVAFSFGKNEVLKDITFSVKKGEYLGIIGPNGGGKTTLLKIIVGLLEPTKGSVKLFGKRHREIKNCFHIGYVPQRITQRDQNFPATAREIVNSGRLERVGIFKKCCERDDRAIEKALEIAGVNEYKDKRIGDLSGGQLQRVFIARALASDSKLLILDEPGEGVDITSQQSFYSFLKKINKGFGITIVFVSHDIDVVTREADNIICLNGGLVCHVSSKSFSKEQYLKDVYGNASQYVRYTC